jgi:hypothetical protein
MFSGKLSALNDTVTLTDKPGGVKLRLVLETIKLSKLSFSKTCATNVIWDIYYVL